MMLVDPMAEHLASNWVGMKAVNLAEHLVHWMVAMMAA